MNRAEIPQTDSIQALAEFWDTHDLTDFEAQLETVTEPVFDRDAVVQIHLQPADVATVKQVAQARGMDYTDLIQQWVVEKIRTA